jgi:hypothetical protein
MLFDFLVEWRTDPTCAEFGFLTLETVGG